MSRHTCTRCGLLGSRKGGKILYCKRCDEFMDRDLRGARNIYIKTSEIFKEIRPANGSVTQ